MDLDVTPAQKTIAVDETSRPDLRDARLPTLENASLESAAR